MDVLSYPLGSMQANCYLVVQDKNCLVIDPADSADFILEEIQRRNLLLIGMLATHGHFDHIMAAGEIQLSYPQMPLYIHPKDEFLLKRVGETAKYFLGFEPNVIPIHLTKSLDTKTLEIKNFKLQILNTPGHTPGSCSLYFREEAIIFTGDTLFSSGVGRYDFKYSDKKELKRSVQTLLKLPEFTTIYPGHGEDTLIQMEIAKKTIDLIP